MQTSSLAQRPDGLRLGLSLAHASAQAAGT